MTETSPPKFIVGGTKAMNIPDPNYPQINTQHIEDEKVWVIGRLSHYTRDGDLNKKKRLQLCLQVLQWVLEPKVFEEPSVVALHYGEEEIMSTPTRDIPGGMQQSGVTESKPWDKAEYNFRPGDRVKRRGGDAEWEVVMTDGNNVYLRLRAPDGTVVDTKTTTRDQLSLA